MTNQNLSWKELETAVSHLKLYLIHCKFDNVSYSKKHDNGKMRIN